MNTLSDLDSDSSENTNLNLIMPTYSSFNSCNCNSCGSCESNSDSTTTTANYNGNGTNHSSSNSTCSEYASCETGTYGTFNDPIKSTLIHILIIIISFGIVFGLILFISYIPQKAI